jgi:hypothetical protein
VPGKCTIIEAARTRTIYNWLQYLDPDTLRAEVADQGWMVDEVLGDVAGGDYDPSSPELAVVLRPSTDRS